MDSAFENWFVSMNWICEDSNVYNGIASYYFVGYFIGIILFWMPDTLGRKTTMNFLLPNYVIATAMVIFSHSMLVKSIGFFLMGFFHLKISLSYSHGFDLVPGTHKSLVTTLITAYDSGTPMFACIFFKFISKNQELCFRIHFLMGFTGCVLYFFLIPESPRWLLLKKGPNCKEAIAIFNYIAWFNGSKMRVPDDATFDIIGQVIEE